MTGQPDAAAGAASEQAGTATGQLAATGRSCDSAAAAGSGGAETSRGADAGRHEASGPDRGIQFGRAAVLIGTLTVLARIVGFGRQLVFTRTVGFSCLGTAYSTANQVPNIVYDVLLGGVLTSLLVPLLARPASRAPADPEQARLSSRTSSALLTWSVLILIPASIAVAALARPIATLLVPAGTPAHCPSQQQMVTVTARMLAVFAPQIALYGIAVVLYGILQAHRKFAGPALAPMLSSLIVIGAYLAFVPLGEQWINRLGGLPLSAELTLSVGTTAGVAVLMLAGLVPALRLRPRLRLRPALRFPPGIAARAGSLAAAGIAALVAQDLAATVIIRLANSRGQRGPLVMYNSAWQAFLVPYAVLAFPIAISAFPGLATLRGAEFDRTAAASTRAVLLASGLGAALLAAAARPLSQLFSSQLTVPQAHQLTLAIAAFAPGLFGFGLIASQSRVLLAAGRYLSAGCWMSAGWLVVIAVDIPVVLSVRPAWVVPAFGLGNTAGLTVAGLGLLAATQRARGSVALAGTLRAAAAGLAGGLAGAAAGLAAVAVGRSPGFGTNVALGVLACSCAAAGFLVVAYLVDRGDLRLAIDRARHRRPASP